MCANYDGPTFSLDVDTGTCVTNLGPQDQLETSKKISFLGVLKPVDPVSEIFTDFTNGDSAKSPRLSLKYHTDWCVTNVQVENGPE